jgi:selenoprotein W-related protein
MTTVEIEYCVPCGMRDRAVDLQESLLETYGERLDAVSLVTGDSGVFKVHAEDDLIFDKDEDDYDVDAIVADVDDYVSATA